MICALYGCSSLAQVERKEGELFIILYFFIMHTPFDSVEIKKLDAFIVQRSNQ